MTEQSYFTRSGIQVTKTSTLAPKSVFTQAVSALDDHHGALLECTYARAPRYREKSLVFIDPPLRLSSSGTTVRLDLLQPRGSELFQHLCAQLDRSLNESFQTTVKDDRTWQATFAAAEHEPATEVERSRMPSPLTVVAAVCDALHNSQDPDLGLFGALGYDLVFHFEPRLRRRLRRADAQRDLVLYLPDRLVVTYPDLDASIVMQYGFGVAPGTVNGHYRARPVGDAASEVPTMQDPEQNQGSEERDGSNRFDFLAGVAAAHEAFARGDLFEVVLSESFARETTLRPSGMYEQLRRTNVAPYSGLLNLGEDEFLVVSSPEMFLRVTGRQLESCPIAGTVARSPDPLEDFANLRELLLSEKAESELVMCTDVDRNDKSLVCEPGSVRVLAHRDVETTSRVMHTVEHLTGVLREGFTGLDALISHMWAVTVTGAPKIAAVDFIERHEDEPRRWYAGAFGRLSFTGDIDTGITIRAIHVHGTTATVRAGSTLLAKSEAQAEQSENGLKAAALLGVLDGVNGTDGSARGERVRRERAPHVLVIDHEDSFVHTLADYFRQLHCRVSTIRSVRGQGVDEDRLADLDPQVLCLSPGPGSPSEFRISKALRYAQARRIPTLGVCLGGQAIAEHFGATLARQPAPAHGVQSTVSRSTRSRVLRALPERFQAGRYHSLHVLEASLPTCLPATAWTDEGTVMCVEHSTLPIVGVQFHPESIMTAAGRAGHTIIETFLDLTVRADREASSVDRGPLARHHI